MQASFGRYGGGQSGALPNSQPKQWPFRQTQNRLPSLQSMLQSLMAGGFALHWSTLQNWPPHTFRPSQFLLSQSLSEAQGQFALLPSLQNISPSQVRPPAHSVDLSQVSPPLRRRTWQRLPAHSSLPPQSFALQHSRQAPLHLAEVLPEHSRQAPFMQMPLFPQF